MKLNGLMGKGSGKLGSSIFAISGGEQIVRQYNPVVSNPQTEAQVAQRAKLKLMSQLAAALAPYIAIPKKGLVSARNQFISKNIGLARFADDTANVALEKLQLTIGSVFIPQVVGRTDHGSFAGFQLDGAAPDSVDKVCYIVGMQGENDELSIVATQLVETAGEGHNFVWSSPGLNAGTYVVWAYGFTSVNGGANTAYSDYETESDMSVAELVATRSIAVASGNLTKTTGDQVTIE